MFNSLGRSLGPLTAIALGLGMPGFGLGSLAVFGLPPRRLPLADLAETFRLLAVRWFHAAAGTRGHTLCACSAVGAVGAFWPGNEAFA